MAKYKVKWVNVVEYYCEHVVEASSEEEAIKLAGKIDSDKVSKREEQDNFDKEQTAEEC